MTQVDRRAAPAIRVHTRGLGMDVLFYGHGISTTERILGNAWRTRVNPGHEHRRCMKCLMGAPADYLISKTKPGDSGRTD